MLHLTPLDIFEYVSGFVIGSVWVVIQFRRNPIKGIGVLMQVAVLWLRMAKHYFDTHPDAKNKVDLKTREAVEKLYRKYQSHLPQSGQELYSEKTGAIG